MINGLIAINSVSSVTRPAGDESAGVSAPPPVFGPARPESPADARRALSFGVMYPMALFKRTLL